MFSPMSGDKEPAFWQQILLVAIPALVGACLPPIISHHLENSRAKNKATQTPPPMATPVTRKKSSPKEKLE